MGSKTRNWKFKLTSVADKENLTDIQVEKIMTCYNDEEYQDFKKSQIEGNKAWDNFEIAKWQLQKADEIEELWHKSIKYKIVDNLVYVDVNFEIDFPKSFDKGDVSCWCEDLNRINCIYLMVQMKDIVNESKMNANYDVDKNENEFIVRLIGNENVKIKKKKIVKDDTIIPVKFGKKLTIEEIDEFSNLLVEFEKKINVVVTPISMSAVAKRINKK